MDTKVICLFFFFSLPPLTVGNHTGRIKVVFTPSICKVTCTKGNCQNNCEKGNTTTLISENGHAADTLTATNFRVGKYPETVFVLSCPLLTNRGRRCFVINTSCASVTLCLEGCAEQEPLYVRQAFWYPSEMFPKVPFVSQKKNSHIFHLNFQLQGYNMLS